jgi:hypothetical protein
LKDIRPGMHGVGRTVFSGNRIEEFDVEILGVLENTGPHENIILGRLSGGPLAETGVMQGMSGSPVYIDGKLVGAVALAYAFSKEPIAGIRPIEDMIRPTATRAAISAPRAPFALGPDDLLRNFPKPALAMSGNAQMVDIATPLSFGGFTRATLDAFAPQLRSLGLEPRQAVSSAGKLSDAMGNPADLHPGSMISVQLLSGDYNVGADGTVTYIDGNRLYAFGHRFLDVGPTSLPFARSEVLALIPNTQTSFKLSAAKEWMGTIGYDGNTAVSGQFGTRASTIPVSVTVMRAGRKIDSYRMNMVNDPMLSPLLVQMAVFSSIDATERTVGAATIRLTGAIDFQNVADPVRIDNMFSADTGTATQAALFTAVPVAYVMQSDQYRIPLKSISLNIEAFDQKKQLTIDGLTVSQREAHPGDTLHLNIALVGENGAESTRQLDYKVPIGAEPGPLFFTVADANTSNITDFHQAIGATAHSANQVIGTVNLLHPNTRAYLRVWRTDPAFQLEGVDLPAPPASVSLVMSGWQSSLAGVSQSRNSKIAEMEIDAGDVVISGVKTVQVDIKE